MWFTSGEFASAPYHACEYYRRIDRTIVSRVDRRRLKLPLRESTSRLWRKARGDLPVPERIQSLEWIRKVSHAAATATARKGDREARGKEEGRGEGGGERGKGSTGTRHQDSTLRRVHFLHTGVHIRSFYKPQCESFAGVVVVVVALRMTSLQIPEHVVLNETVRMQCNFNLDKEQLYSVKWYKDGHEFYRFTPRDRPEVLMFPVRGVNVNVSATCKDT